MDIAQLLSLRIFAMQLLDLPTHIALCLNHLRCLCLVWVIGNNPLNVTVCGNYLE